MNSAFTSQMRDAVASYERQKAAEITAGYREGEQEQVEKVELYKGSPIALTIKGDLIVADVAGGSRSGGKP